jgi:hypothetical protein
LSASKNTLGCKSRFREATGSHCAITLNSPNGHAHPDPRYMCQPRRAGLAGSHGRPREGVYRADRPRTRHSARKRAKNRCQEAAQHQEPGHYAAQAPNVEAERRAAEIRIRAERRAGELLKLAAAAGQRQKSGGTGPRHGRGARLSVSSAPTLPDIGITRDQSSDIRWTEDHHRLEAPAHVSGRGKEAAVGEPQTSKRLVSASWYERGNRHLLRACCEGRRAWSKYHRQGALCGQARP